MRRLFHPWRLLRNDIWPHRFARASWVFLLFAAPLFAQTTYDWNSLGKYQKSITRKEFCRLLDKVYNPSKAIYAWLNVTDDFVEMYSDPEKTGLDFTLYFAKPGDDSRESQKTFKTISDLQKLDNTADQPLKGIRMVLDPGHIGGKWADTEERCVIWGDNPVIKEGDKNLIVAKLLKARLEAAGAKIYMTHDKPEPVTPLRTKDFLEEARDKIFADHHLTEETFQKQKKHFLSLINWTAELYFYRRAEIAQRAENIRRDFLPDLTICNHFNATERSGARELTKDNRYAFFINGCYGPDELANPEWRFYMFSKLLEQPLDLEMTVADAITEKMLKISKLPPVKYGHEKYECPVNKNPYLYARNLAATRMYPGPDVYMEPFYMNNPWTAARMAAGDYDGVKNVAGGKYRSLYREYADAVADAVIETYSKWTVPSKEPRMASNRQCPSGTQAR